MFKTFCKFLSRHIFFGARINRCYDFAQSSLTGTVHLSQNAQGLAKLRFSLPGYEVSKKDVASTKFAKGFSLVEIMVAVSVFSIVMVISMGSILSVLDANKKSQTLRAVMDNVNSTLESMTRTIRFGQNYHCGPSGDLTLPQDCSSGSSFLTVKANNGTRVTYKLDSGRIARSINGGTDSFITSPDVTITNLTFRVFGSAPYSNGSDLFQPQVIIVVSGFAGLKPTSQTTFTLETTVSQRLFDFQ